MHAHTHYLSICFTVKSDNEEESLTADEIRAAIMQRIRDLDASGEWTEAVEPY